MGFILFFRKLITPTKLGQIWNYQERGRLKNTVSTKRNVFRRPFDNTSNDDYQR
ncbi:hypothetical protein HMPREF3156_02220 [Neisseria sp. HMSC06F02]|nr:hypothetical protein HMPREF3156_02220 [Neisseria sp. HMSC06F02]